ncbi:MAG: cytochrome c biogenesis protein CcsA [Bacteroidales bacterium]|nr:cytochrome c biogenesis protein CcsA [Bacteroidales bacterium]
MAVLILAMVAATVIEKSAGTPAAFSAVYHHPLFLILWGVAAISGIALLLKSGAGKKVAVMGIHLSFVLILAGALVTYLAGEKGTVRLERGVETSGFQRQDGTSATLGFSLTMTDFSIPLYAGSAAASDYVTRISWKDGSESGEAEISMNHIFRRKGYRFYQAGYEQDGNTSILSVNHDPWGIGLTYAGYLCLLLSMIAFFFRKDSRFRLVLKRVTSVSAVLVPLLLPQPSSARESALPPAVPEEVADAFGRLYVYYNDRVAPMETMTRDYCMKAYGKPRWENYSAEQAVTGWLFYYDWWNVVPFKLKAKDRGTAREAEKERIRMDVATGKAFKIFPVVFPDSLVLRSPGLQRIVWFSCDDPLPDGMDYDQWVFIRKSLDLVHDEIQAENWDEVIRILGQIRKYQEKTASEVLPPDSKVRAERLYNRIFRPRVPFMATITIGLILFILFGISFGKGRPVRKGLQHAVALLSAVLWLYLTAVLALRWYVSGHAPLSGSYSVMMLMAWLSTLSILLLYRKFPMIEPLGLLVAGFTMLVASLAGANPQITHLMPVLQSPLLSIHVLSMMISYTLFALVAMNGIMGLAFPGKEASQRLMDISLVVLYPAVFLLTAGTFLGAVWANVSWGSYWAWDPKETWALITMLIYAAALHGGSLKAFRRPRFFHAFCILAFLAVLITYFGVNLFLGGMHSYA